MTVCEAHVSSSIQLIHHHEETCHSIVSTRVISLIFYALSLAASKIREFAAEKLEFVKSSTACDNRTSFLAAMKQLTNECVHL